MQISKELVVSFHYSLLNDKAEVIETSREQDAIVYLYGHNQIVPGLEESMLGKSAGDKFQVKVKAERGYGAWDESKVYDIEAQVFSQMADLSEGLICQVTNPDGLEELVTVVEIAEDIISVDANHPYAGQDLKFSVEIVAVRNASERELAESKVIPHC
jgi:FKBP-type peptidyl-prolyl cis-trans isomerase SlyD